VEIRERRVVTVSLVHLSGKGQLSRYLARRETLPRRGEMAGVLVTRMDVEIEGGASFGGSSVC
jgi:hypothetical protein